MQEVEHRYADYNAWNPKEYLTDYYSEILLDERFTLEFLADTIRKLPPIPVALDFGSGPVIPHIFPLVPKAGEIHLSEYLHSNRLELEKWLNNEASAHNWRNFTLEALGFEGMTNPSFSDAEEREEAVRKLVTQVLPGDVTSSNPIGLQGRNFYPLVTALYCAEAVSPNQEIWRNNIENIMSLVKPGGTLILASCGLSSHYQVGNQCFPCTRVEPQDMLAILYSNNFTNIDLRVRRLPAHSGEDAGLVIFAAAVKPE